MNYRHAYHAGNFADVVKHLALVAILLHLRKKDAPFAVIDTHAGRGRYDLGGEEASRTGESANGIGRLGGVQAEGTLGEYLTLARQENFYPGSPLLAAMLLRRQDRLIAVEKHADEAAALERTLAPYPNARAEDGDGYARLSALLPPQERRGLVLIDPPFESDDEFARAAAALRTALRRFATGIYLLWFPVKSQAGADAFAGEVLNAGAKKALRIDIDVGSAPADDGKERLRAAGLVIVNPPFGLAAQMQAALAKIAPLLTENARFSVQVLAGD